jgi:transposase InsO family protein
MTHSISRKANCCDNAPMFFLTLKVERVRVCQYPDREAARRDRFAYIEAYYNRRPMHSVIG